MNQLLIVSDLPEWILKLAEDVLIVIAELTGHSVLPGSVRKVDEKESDEQ